MSESTTKFTKILKEYWGHDSFRPMQEDIIQSVFSGKDTLGLLPTGGGKSITFQVPALAQEGMCIVVSPLIALMKDQVQNLTSKGIKAIALHSGLQTQSTSTLLDNAIFGNAKFLYVSPERLKTKLFIERIPHMNVNLIAIDEAHCISQWGYDFRPSYLNIATLRESFPGIPILALTATATPRVVNDIQERLLFPEPNVFQKSFERKNLVYFVKATEDKYNYLLRLLANSSGSAIVYVRSRKGTKELAAFLEDNKISATFFHAGLDGFSKDKRQKDWTDNKTRVIVATNAFGMGIDKPDVRLVVHFDLPDSPENYFQEAGRAGRDGDMAYAVQMVSKSDKTKLLKRISDTYPKKEYIRRVYEALGNYYGIGYESGAGRPFNFDLRDFAKTFKLNSTQTYHAIKILHKAQYLEYTDEQEASSRIHFSANKFEIYRFQEENEKFNLLIKTILRSYTGLFSDYAFINEEELAKRTGLTRKQVYDLLIAVSKSRLISYVPGKKTPVVRYLQDRCDMNLVRIPRSVYEDLKQQFELRVHSMINYTSRTDKCRSLMLLQYFGDTKSDPCGNCDVCRDKKNAGIFYAHPQETIAQIIQTVKEAQKLSLAQIADQLQLTDDLCQKIVRHLLDNKRLQLNEDDTVSVI